MAKFKSKRIVKKIKLTIMPKPHTSTDHEKGPAKFQINQYKTVLMGIKQDAHGNALNA